jgi:ribosome recycling factor
METFVKELETALQAAVQKLREEFGGVRSNRPSVGLVENIMVECYERTMPIKQLGSLGIRAPRDIDITVWDQSIVATVAKAIQDAKVGLSVSNEGNVVRATLPPLTDERRAEFMKLVKRMAEEARIKIRGHRDDIVKKIKAAEADKKMDEDAAFRGKEKAQKVVDEVNKKIEAMLEGKLKELSE